MFPEGDGESSSKGLKIEWMTVRDNILYTGSFGKPYQDPVTGEILNNWNQWIVVMDIHGNQQRKEWSQFYDSLNDITKETIKLDVKYMIQEAVRFSHFLRE